MIDYNVVKKLIDEYKDNEYIVSEPYNVRVSLDTLCIIFSQSDELHNDIDYADALEKLQKGETIKLYTHSLGKVVVAKKWFEKDNNLVSHKSSIEEVCDHSNKYISQNFSGGVRYWVCPTCKSDLGDA